MRVQALLLTLVVACSSSGSDPSGDATAGSNDPNRSANAEDGASASSPNGSSSSSAGSGGATAGSGATGGAGNDGGDAVGSGAACRDLPFCDDFESTSAVDGSSAANGWSVVTPNCSGTGAVTLDTSGGHSGSRSLKVAGGGGYCNHVFVANARALAKHQDALPLYIRFFVRLGSSLGDDHVTMMAMHDSGTGKDLRFGGQKQIFIWNRESDDATLPELSPAGVALSVVPTVGSWHCVETRLAAATAAGASITTSVDGAVVTGLEAAMPTTKDVNEQWQRSGLYSPAPTDVRFGWESYGGAAETLWLDDIAVSDAPIGCGS